MIPSLLLATLLALTTPPGSPSGVVLAASPASSPASAEVKQVRAAFEAYRKALTAKDGKRAADAVDAASLDYYDQMKALALTATEEALKQRSMVDRLIVLRLRLQIGLEKLLKLDGRALLRHGVDQGWISAQSVKEAELGEVAIEGDKATAEYVRQGQVTPLRFEFRREAKRWRLSLVPLMQVGEPSLKALAQQLGRDENELVVSLLEKVSGGSVPATVWQPLQLQQPPPAQQPPAPPQP